MTAVPPWDSRDVVVQQLLRRLRQPHAGRAGAADGRGRGARAQARHRPRRPGAVAARAPPPVGAAHRQGVRGGSVALRLRRDDAGRLVHLRPGGDPEDPAASAPARGAGPRAAGLSRRHRPAAQGPGGSRAPAERDVCLQSNTRAAITRVGGHPRPARWGGRPMSAPAMSPPARRPAFPHPQNPCAPLRPPTR